MHKKPKSLVFDNGKCTTKHLKFKKYTTIKYRESKYFLIYWFYCWIFDSLYWMKNDKWNKRRDLSFSFPSFDRSHPKRNFIVASCIPIKREWSNSRKWCILFKFIRIHSQIMNVHAKKFSKKLHSQIMNLSSFIMGLWYL